LLKKNLTLIFSGVNSYFVGRKNGDKAPDKMIIEIIKKRKLSVENQTKTQNKIITNIRKIAPFLLVLIGWEDHLRI